MTTKRRVVIIVVVVALLGSLSGGVAWYMVRNRRSGMLKRAELAFKAGRLDKAGQLAEEYMHRYPDDWRGPYLRGKVRAAGGNPVAARQDLQQAFERASDNMEIAFAIADTYAQEAEALARDRQAGLSDTERAIQCLLKGGTFLRGLSPSEEKAVLDIQQYVGRDLITIGELHQHRSEQYRKQGELAAKAKEEYDARAKAALSREAAGQAQKAHDEATRLLLDAVQKDPARTEAGLALLNLCRRRGDDASYALARKAILTLKKPPPEPALWVAMYELRKSRDEPDPAVRRQKLTETAEVLDRLIRQNPDHVGLKTSRAQVALGLGDLKTAQRLCQEAIEAKPREPETRYLRTQVLQAQGHLAEAERELHLLTVEYRNVAALHYAYAEVALALGKRGTALQVMQTVKKLDPNHGPARTYLARLLLEKGLADEAYPDASKAYELQPQDPQSLWVYLQASIRSGRDVEAGRAMGQVSRHEPPRPEMLIVVADGWKLLGRPAEAQAVAKQAAEARCASDLGRLAAARALLFLGRAAEAEKLFRDELARAGENAALRMALGQLYEQSGRLLEAIEQYRRAVGADPTNPEYLTPLAQALLNAGDLEECRSVLERIDPDRPDARILRLQVRLILGQHVDPDEMLHQIQTTEKSGLHPALVHLATGQPMDCIRACQEELKKDRTSVPARMLLGQARRALGDLKGCIQVWAEAVEVAPDRLGTYLAVAAAMAIQGSSPDEAASRLQTIPGAKKHLVALAKCFLLAEARQYAQAAASVRALLTGANLPPYVRGRARLLLAQYLAQSDQAPQALVELQQLAADPPWRKLALLRQAQLLVAGGGLAQADDVLTQIRGIAEADLDTSVLRRVVDLYLAMHQRVASSAGSKPAQPPERWLAKAKAVCQQHERLLPTDSSSSLLWARVWAAAGDTTGQIQAYRAAIERQPGEPRTYLALARILDDLAEPVEALNVLDDLEAVSQTAKTAALWERGSTFARWGLQEQAVKQFDRLAQAGYRNPRLEFQLGQAFARVGLKNRARELLGKVPSYSSQYVAARLLLASLSPVNEERLDILKKLAEERPANDDVLVAKMAVLLALKRSKETAEAFGEFVAKYKHVPAQGGLLALEAQLQAGNRRAAANLCVSMYAVARVDQWRRLAMLLMLDDRPEMAAKMLSKPDQADPQEDMLGVCVALQTMDLKTAGIWAERAKQPPSEKVGGVVLASVLRPYTLLAELAVSDKKPSPSDIKMASVLTRMRQDVVAELASRPPGLERTKEAAELLKASLALDLGLRVLGRQWALEVLKARGTCQWAAALLLRSQPDEEGLAAAHKLLEPKDSPLALILQADVLLAQKRYARAAELLGQAANVGTQDPALIARQAAATLAAGNRTEAMDLYRKAWLLAHDPVAANDAANLACRLYEGEPARLDEARKWAEFAVQALPGTPALQDTEGWVAHLQGRHDRARQQLRRAVKGLPDEPTVHYHLAMAEAAAGNRLLAAWHLQATVDTANARQTQVGDLDEQTQESLRSAQQALAKLQAGQARPSRKPGAGGSASRGAAVSRP